MTIYKCDRCGREICPANDAGESYECSSTSDYNFELCDECNRALRLWLKREAESAALEVTVQPNKEQDYG